MECGCSYFEPILFEKGSVDNEPLNKYIKNLKNRKKFIDVFFYLWIDVHSNFMQFHYRLIVHQRPSNFHIIYNGYNSTVFDALSNDNEIV
jgi:DAD family